MKNTGKLYLLTIITLLFLSFSNAQDKTVVGFVTAFDSLPVVGAEVKVNSTKETVRTDSLGRFIVPVENSDKLKVSANGFYNQKVKLNENTRYAAINLKLKPSAIERDIAVGYDYVSERNKLGAAASLSNDDINFSQYTSIYDAIEGRFSGVQVLDNGEIHIRGKSTIEGSNAALIVIDGIPVSNSVLSAISPSDVENISVIKDGSAAIYGARGANGVVILETKRAGD